MRRGDDLHALRGGSGDRLLVLLHGIGANAHVWDRMLATIADRWSGRWIAPDLRGHGRSTKQGPFDIRQHAMDVASLIREEGAEAPLLVGHSFGAAVAAAVGAGVDGVKPCCVVGFSVRVDWATDDLARMRGLADRPRAIFATQGEAAQRSLAFAGLKDLATPDAPVARAGIEPCEGGWRLALEPAVFAAIEPTIGAAMRNCRAPLRLGAGGQDAMAPVAPMRAIDPDAVTFPGAGHNAQWEQPDAVWDFVTTSARTALLPP